MHRFILSLFITISCTFLFAQEHFVSSPDKNLKFKFTFSQKKPSYSIFFKGKEIIKNSGLGLKLENEAWNNIYKCGKPIIKGGIENYDLIVGKTSKVHQKFEEMIVPLLISKDGMEKINIIIRLFNEGAAFRYQVTAADSLSFLIHEELSEFSFYGNPLVHALLLPSYTSSHEGYYTHKLLNDIKEDTLIDMPALFEMPNHVYVAITEAALLNYAGMYLTRHSGILRSALSPLPGQKENKVLLKGSFFTPWRVIMVSDRIGDLIESNILTTLSPPCQIKDLSWLKPGKTTFPWWNGDITPDTSFAPGNNFITNKYYIDFCARNNITYHSVVEYGGHEWYMNDGDGFAPGPHADVLTPVPTLHMQEICDYAKEKGVGIRVWVYWSALYSKLDSAFTLYEHWGLKGLMVDFMDRDDQQMVQIQEEILKKAALHHLHIQFHGAYKPTGLSRTYPNEFTREGTLNYEADKWNENGITPDHDIIMPFTRVLAGSTDYHLGGFRAIEPSKFKVQYTRPLVLGTRCHMLAMYVVLENYLAMVCDYPEAYEGQPGFDFIRKVPTTWDETKVLDAVVGKYIVTARRKGTDWYVGSITDHEQRKISIPLTFLSEGNYELEGYVDTNENQENPNKLNIIREKITNKKQLVLVLSPGGGAAIIIKKIN